MTTPSPPLRLPPRAKDAHKGHFGRALLVGGSRGMAGSISLSSMAALRMGSGLVTAAVPDRCLETVASFHPGVMTIPLPDDSAGRFAPAAAAELKPRIGAADVVGCGPGMTTDPGSVRIVECLLQQRQLPRVFDADAINVLSEMGWPDSAPAGSAEAQGESAQRASAADGADPLVLTPHPGELARLVAVSPGDRSGQIDAAADWSAETGAVVVLKGGPTVVVSAQTRWTNTTGNPGIATAGSGDVLTGMITSLLGQGLSPWDAAVLGVWIHGRAGDLAAERLGQSAMVAVDLLDALPEVTRELIPQS